METIIFRKFKSDGSIIALMPDIEATKGRVVSYQHIGQHGEADYPYILKVTLPIKENEYQELLQELVNIGYGIEVDTIGQLVNVGIHVKKRFPKNYKAGC